MGGYTIIADTGQRLVEILQREMVPDIIPNPNGIGLRSPEDHGDVSLGLFLYDIRESEELQPPGIPLIKDEKLRRHPVFLSLFYMVTAYSGGDPRYSMVQEEHILGKVMQTFYDYPIIPLGDVDPEELSGMDLHITLEKMGMEEKSRIWNFPNIGNRLSLFYKVTPVSIDSGLEKGIVRVHDRRFQTTEKS